MWVKVCGIKRREDLNLCISFGVDLVGFNLWEGSPRYIPLKDAIPLAFLAREKGVVPVAVLVNPTLSFLEEVWEVSAFSLLQIYNPPVPPSLPWIRPISHLDEQKVPTTALCDLVDTRLKGDFVEGGDPVYTLPFPPTFSRPTFLGGGITPENLPNLLSRVKPHGIDIARGVEKAPGIKDERKIASLMEQVASFSGEKKKIEELLSLYQKNFSTGTEKTVSPSTPHST